MAQMTTIFDLGPRMPEPLPSNATWRDQRNQLAAIEQAKKDIRRHQAEGGLAVEIYTHIVDAAEMCARDPQRYVRALPEGAKLGPKSGPHRVVRL